MVLSESLLSLSADFFEVNHFICKLDESRQTKQNGLYVIVSIFSQYERIKTSLLLENTYSY